MKAFRPPPAAAPFWIKPVAAALLVLAADQLFYGHPVGATLGMFALLAIAAVVLVQPAARKAWAPLLAAIFFASVLIEAPSLLAFGLWIVAIAVAALSARVGRAEDAWRWLQRLAAMLALGLVAPFRDFGRARRRAPGSGAALRRLPVLVLPVVGGMVFLALFTAANPVIAQAIGQWRFPELDLPRTGFAVLVAFGVWMLLRPAFKRPPYGLPAPKPGAAPLPGLSVASVGLSLVVFNAVFALQNGLDIAFLWSRAPLPEGVSLAEYAHRGAYPLIATALLAGLFVLVALAPGSATARSAWLRRLVVLWVAQNLFLVASSILRTLDYVDVYALTRLRLAALIWMVLVGVGLLLICWRMLRGSSAAWLINANAAAAGLVLAACTVVDLGAVAAAWNVRHARELGGNGEALDVCYLERLGDSSIVALSQLRVTALPPVLAARVAWSRETVLNDLTYRQSRWRGWSWRAERRLDEALALAPRDRTISVPAGTLDCRGVPMAYSR
ncbi:DUF4153 domain-containing protein [Caulobacter hibisci]|uniref:DUF4173 domain-containing protein n=1 Tax=Caulobacter hibisci TaxID=2035993 RepID=A0ABS0T0V4_9CAUL|nr:DUF4173 domain-containing protein [Caulobacter hibisci]MBI1685505.1 DUF4173 domain-containing protein [Caulobacter hibisci]